MTGAWLSWPRPPLAAQPREPVAAKATTRRISFSSPQARAIWKPRLDRLARAAIAVELETVRRRRLPSTLIWVTYGGVAAMAERAQSLGLAIAPVKAALGHAADWPTAESNAEPMAMLDYALLVGTPPLDPSVHALAALAPIEVAAWFGYPPCCARAWSDALRLGRGDPFSCMLGRGGKSDGIGSAHASLAVLGFGPVRHAPCSADCTATIDRSREFIDMARAMGHREEARWLEEMDDWTIDASVVNGVAEVKTGAFRCTWLADEIGPPRRLHRPGRIVPEGTPQGLAGIFRERGAAQTKAARPAKAMPVNAADVDATRLDLGAGFAAAGFDSAFAMRSRFSTVVWEQTGALRRARSAVHVGCGQGLLLELLAQTKPGLRLYGIEEDEAMAEAARRRNGSSVTILCRTYTDPLASFAGQMPDDIDIAFVDPERFAVVDDKAVPAISALARSIIVIATDRSLRRFGDLDTLAAAAGLSLPPGRPSRVSAVARPLAGQPKTPTSGGGGAHELDFH
jgi:hypothetical protein